MLQARRTRRRPLVLAVVFFSVLAWLGLGSLTHAGATTDPSGEFIPVSPSSKIVDTRSSLGVSATLAAASTTSFQVAGAGGVPASGVSAVSLVVKAVNATANGSYLEMWPDGTTRPAPGSTLNYSAGDTTSNSAIVAVGSDGKVDVYNSSGTVDLVVDVSGYFTSGGTSAAGYVPVTQSRLVDTRNGTGAPEAQIAPGGTLNVQIDGVAGVTDEASVYANLIVPASGDDGSLYAYASGGSTGQPVMDYKSVTTSQGAVIPVGANGQITLKNGSSTQSIDVVLDVYGYFTDASSDGEVFTAVQDRLIDTRNSTAIPAGGTVDVMVAGNDGIPTAFGAAVLNLTTTGQQNPGYLRVWPTGQPMPTDTSVDSFQASTSTSDLVIAKPGDQGAVSVYNGSSGTIQLIVDLQGWFSIDGNDDSSVSTVPPVDPTETDLTEEPTDPAAASSEPPVPTDTSSGNGSDVRTCDARGVYTPTSKRGRYIHAFGPYQSNYNGTTHTANYSFSAEASGTIGVSLSGQLKVSLNELVARQEATYGINFSASLTAKLGNTTSGTIGSHKTINGKYGIWRRKIVGTSYWLTPFCGHTSVSTITSYTPYTVGWYTWES